MKQKFNNNEELYLRLKSKGQNKEENISSLNQYYGYFFNEDTDQKDNQFYSQLVQYKPHSKNFVHKVKNYGKKSFFAEKYRKIFWFNIINNTLKITDKLYQQCVQKLKINDEQQTLTLIQRDLNRMDFKIDDQKGKKCLQAFQIYRPDIGYVQGMSYLAWMFLIRMNQFQSFSCFANLVFCDPFVYTLYFFKEQRIRKIKQFFQKCLQNKKPKLFKFLKNLQVEFELFTIQWAYTMFTRAFNLRIISKIWDMWLSQGYMVFFKVSITILQMLQNEIMCLNENDQVIQYIRSQTHRLDEIQFLKILRKQRISQELQLQFLE